MPDFHLVAADCVEPSVLHAAFEAAFADYLIGPFTLAPDQWPAFLARQAVDLASSRVALGAQGAVAAFALIAWRDAQQARLATMGALPAARGSGAAAALLDESIERLGDAGVVRLELEVFAQNERALRLYRSRGFDVVEALHGYTLEAVASDGTNPAPREVDRATAMAWLHETMRRIELPLQVTPACLAGSAAPLVAWQSDDAQCIFHGGDGSVRVASLVDRDPAQAGARSLLQAMARRFAGQAIQVPALQCPGVGGAALRALGARVQPLHQLWMVRPLTAPARVGVPAR